MLRRSNWSSDLTEDCVTYKDLVSVRPGCLTEEVCSELGWALNGTACNRHHITQAVPNVFILSVVLSLGTFGLAVFLKGSRSGRWFPAIVSNSDVLGVCSKHCVNKIKITRPRPRPGCWRPEQVQNHRT